MWLTSSAIKVQTNDGWILASFFFCMFFLLFQSSKKLLPHIRESRTVLDSGFHAVDSGFQVLDSSLCQWNVDSGFQSLVGFPIPWAVLRIPKPMVPDSVSKHFPDFFTWGGKYPDMILTEQDWSITHISWRSFNRHPVRLLLADKADTSVYSYSNP